MAEHIVGKKIVGWSVSSNEEQKPIVQNNIDPRRVVIERREDGSWEAVMVKCRFNGAEGTKKIYFSIGFQKVKGILNGQEIMIERPLEFFLVAGPVNGLEWITAAMRALSLAARAGFAAKALMDFRQVTSSNVVYHGKYPDGKKTRTHDSNVAALAWAIQDELYKRGFLNQLYEERPLEELILKNDGKPQSVEKQNLPPAISAESIDSRLKDQTTAYSVGTCPQPECGGDMVLKDGCPTCTTCYYSKCG